MNREKKLRIANNKENVIDWHINMRTGRSLFSESKSEDKTFGGKHRDSYLKGFRRLLR